MENKIIEIPEMRRKRESMESVMDICHGRGTEKIENHTCDEGEKSVDIKRTNSYEPPRTKAARYVSTAILNGFRRDILKNKVCVSVRVPTTRWRAI